MLDIQPIYQAITELQTEFRQNPSLFFTEHDLASRCYALIQNAIQYRTVTGKDGRLLYLVHHEYPTPFRCDMSQKNCDYQNEDDPTRKEAPISGDIMTWSFSTRRFSKSVRMNWLKGKITPN